MNQRIRLALTGLRPSRKIGDHVRPMRRDALKQSLSIELVQFEDWAMDITDVAATGHSRTGSRLQTIGESHLVNVADDLVHKVTASDVAVAIHGESGFTSG